VHLGKPQLHVVSLRAWADKANHDHVPVGDGVHRQLQAAVPDLHGHFLRPVGGEQGMVKIVLQ